MSFIYVNGERSDKLGLRLLRGFERTNAENDVEEIEVLGRDGVLIVDRKRKKPIKRMFYFTVNDRVDLINREEVINNWLNFTEFKEAELGWDLDYIYLIRPNKPYEIDEVGYKFGEMEIELLIHPVKYHKSGRKSVPIESGGILHNRHKMTAEPIFKLTGTGNMTLSINGITTKFENVQGGVVVDTLNRMVYWEGMQQWDTMLRTRQDDFPYLPKGENVITYTGATSVEVIPNWGVEL